MSSSSSLPRRVGVFGVLIGCLLFVGLLAHRLDLGSKGSTAGPEISTSSRSCLSDVAGGCQTPPNHLGMNRVMGLINNTYNQCRAAKECPERLNAEGAATCVDGAAGGYECKGIDLLSVTPLADMGSSYDGNDIWGYSDQATGKDYALMACMDGLSFVDVTDGRRPLVKGFMPTNAARASIWRDVKTYKGFAFVVADDARGHGMQVFDLSRLNALPGRAPSPRLQSNMTWAEKEVASLYAALDVPKLAPDVVYTEFGSCHNIVINEETGYAYAVGSDTCAGGLHIIDINNPLKPTYAGCFSADGYTHDAQCVIYKGPDTKHQGKEICFAYNEDTLTIVDVSDKTSPTMLSRVTYNNAQYTHQGWLNADQSFLVLNDELDEVETSEKHTRSLTWDVRSLEAPVLAGTFLSEKLAIDHNLYLHNGLVYEANYCAGLRVLDASRIKEGKLSEVAYFDVSPECDAVEFHGSWSNYPYFADGKIIVSSIEKGLFVLKLQE